jgi:hypothetical protein
VQINNNLPPSVSILTLAEELHHTVEIMYQVTDGENDPVTILPQFSLNQGESWQPETVTIPGQSPNEDRSYSAALTTDDTVYWESAADFPNQELRDIRFRILPADLFAGTCESLSVHIDNDQGAVTLTGFSEEQSDTVRVVFDIVESGGDSLQIALWYQADDSPEWTAATVEGTLHIAPEQYHSHIIWNSSADMPHRCEENLLLKLTIADA